MMIKGARKEMWAVAGDLTSIRYRLLGVQASVPPSAQETSQGDLDGEPDVETEIRTVIANGIQSCLDPLIDDLLAAADYQPESGSVEEDDDPRSIADLDRRRGDRD
ncbi:MAG: hypothetical protein JF614_12025 [Acidobacteria bacterium]|nr:hypothetical protein [Acidobacteriota bacterium]